jgi:hypothetical protein
LGLGQRGADDGGWTLSDLKRLTCDVASAPETQTRDSSKTTLGLEMNPVPPCGDI